MNNRPLAPPQIIDPDYYSSHGYPYDHWARLRRTNPIAWCESGDRIPFWAVTRHEHIVEISKQPLIFENRPLLAIRPMSDNWRDEEPPLNQLLNMDPPDHRNYRKLMSRYFTRKRLSQDQVKFDKVAREIVETVQQKESADFVTEVSSVLPLAVIAELMGLPQSDRAQFFRWTNEIIGAEDPEFQREDGTRGPELLDKAITEFFAYASEMVDDRRKQPRDDLTSVLANAKLDGEYLPAFELMSYIVLLVAAGNETTRNATTGGLLALLERPDQLSRLQQEPDLLDSAIEEIVRWSSPVIHFCRMPNSDVTVGDVVIPAGDPMALFYPSANRDELVFDEADRFLVDRHPNPHLGFGIGEHLCLGAHLARAELKAIFNALIPSLDRFSLAGEPDRLQSSFVGGIKHLPVEIR